MTISPLNAAGAAFLAGYEHSGDIVIATPDPVLRRLLLLQAERGSIPDQEYKEACRALGLSKRQVQRKVAALRSGPSPVGRPGFQLTNRHEQMIMVCQGNVALAHRELLKAGEELPAYEVFWRSWHAKPMSMQQYARHGAEGMLDFLLYPPWEAAERNAVWQADHFELPIDVIADGCTTSTVKPWLTVFEDDRTRKCMAWHLTAEVGRRPDAEVVCATIAAGIDVRTEGGVEVGGCPRIMRWDNDANFTAGMVDQLGTQLGFECHAVPPDSGHMKGKVERLGRRVQEQFCVLQPGYTHGPQTYRRRDLYRDTPVITAAELRARLDVWFAEYDRTVHEGTGETPLDRWRNDPTPLRKIPRTRLSSALLVTPHAHKVIRRKGICFKNRFWMSSKLMELTGRTVEVRYPAGPSVGFIEVYVGGRWHCTAWPAKELTDKERGQILDDRMDAYREARDLHDQATRIRVQANADAQPTDATPPVGAVPEVDPLAGDADDLYDLLGRLGTEEGGADHGDPGTEEAADGGEGSAQ